MKIFSSLVCIFCFFIAASKTTLSDDYKSPSESWLETCMTPDAELISYCNGYIQGVVDSLTITSIPNYGDPLTLWLILLV